MWGDRHWTSGVGGAEGREGLKTLAYEEKATAATYGNAGGRRFVSALIGGRDRRRARRLLCNRTAIDRRPYDGKGNARDERRIPPTSLRRKCDGGRAELQIPHRLGGFGMTIEEHEPNGGRRMKRRATPEKVKDAGRLPALRATDSE